MVWRRSAIWRRLWACSSPAILALGGWSSPPADAREAHAPTFDIPAGAVADGVAELARAARISIGSSEPLPRSRAVPVRGPIPVAEALRRILAGTGLAARQVGPTAWRIERERPAAEPVRRPAPDLARPRTAEASPIIVTATKQPLTLLQVPAPLSVMVADETRRRDPAAGTAVVAGSVQGLAMTSLGSGRNRLFIHGIADSAFSGESQSTVAVVLDEARLTYSAPDPDIRLVDMERVEVLKGPQGSLYGTGTLGGIYHLVTRRPALDETSLEAAASASAVAGGGFGYGASAIANLPLPHESAALRLVGYTIDAPGWIDTGPRYNSNGTYVSGARAMLGVEPGGSWRIDLTGFAQWLSSHDSSYVYAPGARTRPAQLAEPHDNDLRHLAARVTGNLGSVTVTAASAITRHDVSDRLDATIGADSFGLPDPATFESAAVYRIWDSEVRFRGSIAGIAWLAGFSHIEARQTATQTLTGFSGTQTQVDADRRSSFDNAAYVDLSRPLIGALSLELGGRLFHTAVAENRTFAAGGIAQEEDKVGLTPSAALAWRPQPDRLLYLRYGSAFRQGGIEISPTGMVGSLIGDELRSLEAGWREQRRDGSSLEFEAWAAWWSDVQSDALQTDGLVETINAGDARIFGAEVSADVHLAGGWRAEGGAEFNSAQLVRNQSGLKIDDRSLPAVPKYTVRAGLRHDFAVGSHAAWARAALRYVGPSRLSFDPAIDRHMGNVLESTIEGHLAIHGTDLGVGVRNAIDNASNVFAYGNPFRLRTMSQFTPQAPTTVTVSVSRRF